MTQPNQFFAVEDAVRQVVARWAGAPPITVVKTAADLPFAASADARGAYLPRSGAVYLVAENLPTEALVGDTAAHELLGHRGPREMLGSNFASFMGAVRAGAVDDWRLQEIRHQVRQTYGNQLHPLLESDEIVAATVEHFFRPETGRLKVKNPVSKRLTAAKAHLGREMLYLDLPATLEQLLGTLLAVEHRLRHGGPLFGARLRLARWYARHMTKPWSPHDRPMSLDESETLLRAEEHRKRDRDELKFAAQGFGFLLLAVAWVVAMGAVVWGFASYFFR